MRTIGEACWFYFVFCCKFTCVSVSLWTASRSDALSCSFKLVCIIFAFVHTTRKDVRSIYLIYVAYIRTCIYVYFVHLFFNSDLHRSISFDLVTVEFLLLFFHGGISFPSLQSNRTPEEMRAKNGDILEQQEVRGWGMPLWAALPRHQTLVYIIFACAYTTRKDVRSILYVCSIYTYVYIRLFRLSFLQFTHRSISFDQLTVEFLLLSFHGGISSSIVAKKEDN